MSTTSSALWNRGQRVLSCKNREYHIRPGDILLTGFADQSHFTNSFSRFIGLAPGVYREIFSTIDPEEPRT